MAQIIQLSTGYVRTLPKKIEVKFISSEHKVDMFWFDGLTNQLKGIAEWGVVKDIDGEVDGDWLHDREMDMQ